MNITTVKEAIVKLVDKVEDAVLDIFVKDPVAEHTSPDTLTPATTTVAPAIIEAPVPPGVSVHIPQSEVTASSGTVPVDVTAAVPVKPVV